MLAEAYRQAVTQFLDLEGRVRLDGARTAGAGLALASCVETPVVSPFAFGLYANQRKESLMFEDPEEAVERMYRQFYGNTAEGTDRPKGTPRPPSTEPRLRRSGPFARYIRWPVRQQMGKRPLCRQWSAVLTSR